MSSPSSRPFRLSRREVLAAAATGLVLPALPPAPARASSGSGAQAELRALEVRHASRLGVYAINHRTGVALDYRADERFAFCSTYKALLAARVLRDFDRDGTFLDRLVRYTRHDLIEGDFVTQLYVQTGMSVRTLCAAALAQSDNVAANLLFGLTGGPAGLTRFFRSLGDRVSRSDRTEPTLNTAVPGDPRDTTTPRAFADDITRLVLGDALSSADRTQLRFWMEGDCVNTARFRAGFPAGWLIADKTGTGDYGTANDIGVVWTRRGTPLTVAVFSTGRRPESPTDDAIVAAAARVVADRLAPGE